MKNLFAWVRCNRCAILETLSFIVGGVGMCLAYLILCAWLDFHP